MKDSDVVIIGAGTAGLTARRQIEKVTSNYLVVDDGPMGTTCARVGCMPSKVLIQVANDFERRKKFAQIGIHGGEELSIDGVQAMVHVRSLRDRFTRSVFQGMESWKDKLVRKKAKILSENRVLIGDEEVLAKKIIIASGSKPVMPKAWELYKEFLVTTDEVFELEKLPKSLAVIGLGVIGCELGQAFYRLGVHVVGITTNRRIAGLTDPLIQDYVINKMKLEFPIYFNGADIIGTSSNGLIKVKTDDKIFEVEKVLLSMGRTPNVDNIGLENLKIERDNRGNPMTNPNTLLVRGTQSVFLPGDVNGDRPILHEAADEGKIAGLNAVNTVSKFKRRTSLGITFCDPNVATVGKTWTELKSSGLEFLTGVASFEGQGRSIVKLKEQGLMHIYGDKNGKILGAELQAPEGEHLAHLLSWCIQMELTVFDVLKFPFYHPVVEEGLRTALRDLAFKTNPENLDELELLN